MPPLLVPLPVNETVVAPELRLNMSVPALVSIAVGQHRTVIVCFCPAPRLIVSPAAILNGGAVEALPVRVPPPVLVTVILRLMHVLIETVPNDREEGDTEGIG